MDEQAKQTDTKVLRNIRKYWVKDSKTTNMKHLW